jgi:IclR family pca regulon transcriptional regulator
MAWHPEMKSDVRMARKTGVQSFERGLALLRAFGAERTAMTTAEAASAAGLTRAAARRLLMTLQEQGYAQFDGKRYSLTPRVLGLGFAWLSA